MGIILRGLIPNALIHGFFLQNWVYRNKAFATRVQGNVYAALAELDNMQSLMYGSNDFVPYEIKYAENSVTVDKPPYSLVHIIDGRNEYGENICDVDELCEASANAIFLSIGAMGDPVASVVDNLLSHISVQSPEIWNGRYARYSSFGISSIYYPAKELHRIVSLDNAFRLCTLALSEVESVVSDKNAAAKSVQNIKQDVDYLLGQKKLNLLNRGFVSDKICPFKSQIIFQIQPFHVSDKGFPAMIDHQIGLEEQNIEKRLVQLWEENGEQFIKNLIMELELRIEAIKNDSKLDNAYQIGWIEMAILALSVNKDDVTRDINTETENINNLQDNSNKLKELAVKSRYIPGFGGR